MEETKPKEYTAQELNEMSYMELREVAKQRGLMFAGKTPKELKLELGAAPEGAISLDLKEGMTEKELQYRREKAWRIPGRLVYPKEIENQIWRVRESNPDAFDNVDFTDKKAQIQHIFTKRVKCVCGELMVMERIIRKRKDRDVVETVDPHPVYKKQCKCGRWYVYHPDREYEVR